MKIKGAVLIGALLPSITMAEEKLALARPNIESYGTLLLGLIFVLGTFLAGAWFLKKSKLLNPGSDQLKMLAQISVGTKEKIAIIQVEGENVLVAITQYNINFLTNYKGKQPSFKDAQSNALENRPSNAKN
jgi:flagellar protein FliO/FliZ